MSMPVIKPSCVQKCGAINDVIESIALMETALSHILNAEGEKIQKAVGPMCNRCGKEQLGLANCISDLININKSVEGVIGAITVLESILQKKLSEALKESCPEPCYKPEPCGQPHKPHCPPDPCCY